MNIRYFSILFCVFLWACSSDNQFASYRREAFEKTPIGESVTKTITLQNPSTSDVQHISGLNFDAGNNTAGNFRIDKVEVGGVAKNPRDKDITIPAGSILQVYVTYQPLNLETTIASFDGWTTGAAKNISMLLSETPARSEPAIHRAILAVVYDHPVQGIIQIELIGSAVPGANGEVSAVGGAGIATCPTDAGTACYTGGFAIELPEIMSGGPKQLELTGPVVFNFSGANAVIDMGTFPPVLLVLKGNGPGEPLEGKPINAVSIIISGVEGESANGTFDGSQLQINDIAFRIRVVLGEITKEDINPGLQASVDFNIKGLTMTTSKPYTNGSITLVIDTTLSEEPSGNPMFDQFLGGARIIVTMDGSLSII